MMALVTEIRAGMRSYPLAAVRQVQVARRSREHRPYAQWRERLLTLRRVMERASALALALASLASLRVVVRARSESQRERSRERGNEGGCRALETGHLCNCVEGGQIWVVPHVE